MKKLRVLQMFFAMLAFAGIVFFGCNMTGNGLGNSSSSGEGYGECDSEDCEQPPTDEPYDCNQDGSCSNPTPSQGVTPSYSSSNGASSSANSTVTPSSAAKSSSSAAASGGTGSCLAAPLSAAPANPQSACISINGKCYKCNPERNANECGQDWLWTGQQATDTYWFAEIPNCGSGGSTPAASSQSTGGTVSSSSRAASSSSTASSGGGNNPYPTLTSGTGGWASRYWDGCKASCGWSANANNNPTKSCAKDGITSVGNDVQSSCNNGTAYTCFSQAPFVDGAVAYAFAASHTNGDCGKCFQIQFDGTSQHVSPSATLAHIKGKTLIIKISNIGGDVSGNQYDLMIPGGGLGQFDSFSGQSGVNSSAITGATRYGGFVTDCISSVGNNGTLDQYQKCLNDKCDAAFTNTDLKSGCKVYASWFGVANNPKFISKEITCPSQLNGKW